MGADCVFARWGYILNQAAARYVSALLYDLPPRFTNCPEPSSLTASIVDWSTMSACLVGSFGVREMSVSETLQSVQCDEGFSAVDLKADSTANMCVHALIIYMVPSPDWMFTIDRALY